MLINELKATSKKPEKGGEEEMKIGAIWSILFGLIALIVGAVMAWTTSITLTTGGYIFVILGIVGLIIGIYDYMQK